MSSEVTPAEGDSTTLFIPTPYVGLDLGSCTTRMAQMLPDKPMPTILRNTLSNEATATVACFPAEGDGARSYGENAAPKAITKAKETVTDMLAWLLEATECTNSGETGYRAVGENRLHAVQVAAYYVKSLLELGCPKGLQEQGPDGIKMYLSKMKLCVTLPSTATPLAYRAMRQACALAGLGETNIQVIPAEDAVALYFHHHQYSRLPQQIESEKEEEEEEAAATTGETSTKAPLRATAVVIDIGAASSSATVLSVSTAVVERVLAQGLSIGTDQIDNGMVDYVLTEIQRQHGIPSETLRGDLKVSRKLLRECRKAKEILSTTDVARVQVECIKDDVDVNVPISRSLLEQIASPYLEGLQKMLAPVRERMETLKGSERRIEVIGGGWRCPCIMEAIKAALQVERLGTALDANLALAEGSAISALLSMASPEDAAALAKPPHAVKRLGFAAGELDSGLSEAERGAVACWQAAEASMAERDEAILQHLAALNQLDALVLQTLSVIESCKMDASKAEAARSYLMRCDDYVRGDGEEASVEALREKLAEVQAHLSSEYPEIEAHYTAVRAEEARKEEELARLSREKKEEENEPKSDPQRLRLAQKRREQGAVLFKQECWGEAQTRFVQALSVLGQLYDVTSEENKTKKAEISLSCHLNIASCSVRLGLWRNAINNCTSAIEISPENAKAYFRRGQAYMGLKEYQDAVKDLEKASVLSKQDAQVQTELGKAKKALEAQKQKEKKMYAKMFA